jgi:hypothetical protein
VVRILLENPASTEWSWLGTPVIFSGLSDDLIDQIDQSGTLLLNAQVNPARKRLEDDIQPGGKFASWRVFTPLVRIALSGSIKPDTLVMPAWYQCFDRVCPWPVNRSGYQPLFDTLGEHILQSSYLRSFFIRHRDGLVATFKQRTSPMMEPSRFLGEIGVQIAHEQSKLAGALGREEEMVVVWKESVGMDLDFVALHSLAQDPKA